MTSPLPGRPFTWRPRGLSDALDGSNAFQGAMSVLRNLIPSADTPGVWAMRPASILQTNFSGDATLVAPAQVTALLTVGNIAYGMIAETSGTFSGKDVPFAYNVATGNFETIAFPQGATALPTTQSNTGEWTPPIMAAVDSKICITHPGFAGASSGFYTAWLDISGFTSTTITGNTHTTTTVDNLSSDVLQAGWTPGMVITDSAGDIPANTVIVSIATGGLSLTLSRAATGTHTGTTFTVSGGTATAPTYFAGNTNGTPLPAVPVSVAQMAGSAFYAVGTFVYITDALVPTQITNATQAVNMGNGLNVTALGALPLSTSQTGGVIQSIIAFQANIDGTQQMYQISGNIFASPSTLAVNQLGIAVSTLAPLTICPTPQGLAFVAADGVRIVNFLALISDPLGANGQGVNVPFLNAVYKSRMCASCNQNVLRISVQNGAATGDPVQEYWYDFHLKTWSGPHDFPASMIQPLGADGFLLAASGVNAKLFASAVIPTASDTYTENGNAMTWTYEPVLLPDNQAVSMNAVIESTITIALPQNQTVNAIVYDDTDAVLDQILLMGGSGPSSIWGTAVWGSFIWGAGAVQLRQRLLKWTVPLVFKQGTIQFTGNSQLGTELGNLYMRVQDLGYILEYA